LYGPATLAIIFTVCILNLLQVNWQFYSGGVYDAGCDDELDHGILAVGYGHYDPGTNPNNSNSTAVPMDYWLAKNSWGASVSFSAYPLL